MATVLTKAVYPSAASDTSSSTSLEKKEPTVQTTAVNTLALGTPSVEKRFWFQRSKVSYDPNAIATQPSVYDDAETAKEYQPRADW
jgi:hypothetical protein